ncbi:uncharacterized protein SPPG_07170 [Spizellomyces punctatus DAOM BR117]|uniref:Uncharacterized protein n=1 Tax=Spizellomyces punctatus (strain DAOM BR117) TaxID=645134 RepID=A0A0L0H942_SPIPD|nr:uncharacterized protein SPPG_07170 [Spizellomyces punctatus DAOM BR117]KNC97707.1 hypothetical protein SPPG_07170 [Spizellomyces punctatus DAOM BR117]|eukprot:XP_016605747.1 hypothetical protein SPPG_07170 [Spizellomyces punctatus DAOM BR117]
MARLAALRLGAGGLVMRVVKEVKLDHGLSLHKYEAATTISTTAQVRSEHGKRPRHKCEATTASDHTSAKRTPDYREAADESASDVGSYRVQRARRRR